jgi:Glycosyltransferases involved in cell wall biogenesis
MAISIIIPSYNRADLLQRTLSSIASQTSSDWECIVVDDFSKDNTKEVVEDLMKSNPQISYYLNSHKKGAQGARNTGLDHAKYHWVIFFDSDNNMHPDFIETMIGHLSENIDVLACCADIVDINTGKTGRTMNPNCFGNIHDDLFNGKCYVDFNQAVIRKSKIQEIGCLDEDCPSMQEWDTHIRLSRIAKYTMINDCLIDYFMGGEDAISSNKKREVVGRLYILKKHLDEWERHSSALTNYCTFIFRAIRKNEDKAFKREKYKELIHLVPSFPFRFIGYRLKLIIRK